MMHPKAIIDPTADIASDVQIGPWSVIGAHVQIGSGCVIGPHVVIGDRTQIGQHNKIYAFASVGQDPQHLGYSGEPTYLSMGDHNIVREYCTLNSGTFHQGTVGCTRIGHHNFFMAYAHVGHDCVIGNHAIFVNNATLAGHVRVDDFATVGAFVGVHQFCKIGTHSFISRAAMIVKDVLPYMMVTGGMPVGVHGLNKVGLKRHGYTKEQIHTLQSAYHIIYRQNKTVTQALSSMQTLDDQDQIIQRLCEDLRSSSRGILR